MDLSFVTDVLRCEKGTKEKNYSLQTVIAMYGTSAQKAFPLLSCKC